MTTALHTILLVDDDAETRRGIATLLEGRGHRVLEATSAAEASEALERDRPDLVLVDGALRDLPGLEWAEAVRAGGSMVKMVYLTAQWRELDALRARIEAAGLLRTFRKPLNLTLLGDAVQELLEDGLQAVPAPAAAAEEATLGPGSVAQADSEAARFAAAPLASAPTYTDPLIGASVGSFRISRKLGSGGMGSVYLAEHPVIGSKVAVKFLHEAVASSEDAVQRFFDEARVANLIGNENIVNIIDLDRLPSGRPYIVMEYLDGVTLTSYLKKRSFAPRAALAILVQVGDALHAAHAQGIIHRDVKPDNIFLLHRTKGPPLVKLVDFGLAKLREEGSGDRTDPGTILGTPKYMSPEQCAGRVIDDRSDMYAFGVIAYEMLAGRLPFTATNAQGWMAAHANEHPVDPREHVPALDERLSCVVLRMLAKRPEDRFEDMGAAVQQLRDLLTSLPIGEQLSGEWSFPRMPAVVASPPASPSTSTPPAQAAQPGSGKGPLIGVAGAVAALIVGLGVWTSLDGDPRPAESARVPVVVPASESAPPAPAADPVVPVVARVEPEERGETAPLDAGSEAGAKPAAAPAAGRAMPVGATGAPPVVPAKAAEPALLTLTSKPWGMVVIDGKSTGRYTPVVDLPITKGRHTVEIVNEKLGKRASFVVDAKPGVKMTESHTLQ